MKETKFINCEQYVLARMFNAEEENEKLKVKVAAQEDVIKYLTERYDEVLSVIQKSMTVCIDSIGKHRYISVASPWEQYDDNFDQWVELFGLELPELPTESDTDTNEEDN